MSTTARRLSPAQLALLILRVTMEIGVVVALAYWGVHVASSTGLAVVLGIGAPLVGFGIWGTVDFHQAGPHAEWLRLAEELTITLLAAAALYQTGQPAAGVALATLSIIYHTLVYATGTTLLDS